jgi:hypothetical protein
MLKKGFRIIILCYLVLIIKQFSNTIYLFESSDPFASHGQCWGCECVEAFNTGIHVLLHLQVKPFSLEQADQHHEVSLH